jgi:hypothetical protein
LLANICKNREKARVNEENKKPAHADFLFYILFLITSSISAANLGFSFKKAFAFSLHCPSLVSQ